LAACPDHRSQNDGAFDSLLLERFGIGRLYLRDELGSLDHASDADASRRWPWCGRALRRLMPVYDDFLQHSPNVQRDVLMQVSA